MATKSSEGRLLQKLKQKKATVSVIGLGYVGLPLAHAFADRGFRVNGVDINAKNVERVNRGANYIPDIDSASFRNVVKKGKLRAFTDPQILEEADVVIVCVPTPLNRFKDPDISFIVNAAEGIKRHLHPGQLLRLLLFLP